MKALARRSVSMVAGILATAALAGGTAAHAAPAAAPAAPGDPISISVNELDSPGRALVLGQTYRVSFCYSKDGQMALWGPDGQAGSTVYAYSTYTSFSRQCRTQGSPHLQQFKPFTLRPSYAAKNGTIKVTFGVASVLKPLFVYTVPVFRTYDDCARNGFTCPK